MSQAPEIAYGILVFELTEVGARYFRQVKGLPSNKNVR
jgi:hypothetical protein